MFFENSIDGSVHVDLFELVRDEIIVNSDINLSPYSLRSIPTHTEDGIPIRKLFVPNLPPRTTRSDLFSVFAQYGFIKSCWIRAFDKEQPKSTSRTYAFVTFNDPADAYKALQSPDVDRMLRGRYLKVYPADSWHQPLEDADGKVAWRTRGKPRTDFQPQENSSELQNIETAKPLDPTTPIEDPDVEEEEYGILDILNQDCLAHIFSYVSIRDLVRSERVSKRWQSMILQYIQGIHTYKTSWWQHGSVTLTTSILRQILQRLGPSLQKLHIDHYWSALNDRTANAIGKFCPHLKELKIIGMHTKNWSPLAYGCKELKSISFISCSKLSDTSLANLFKYDPPIEHVAVKFNSHVTGFFLSSLTKSPLKTLEFHNCFSLQGTSLNTALHNVANLTCLKLDTCPVSMWNVIPVILSKIPKLEELSLCEYGSPEEKESSVGERALNKALSKLTQLKKLSVCKNMAISNAVLKQIAQSCLKLESLNVSCCNPRRSLGNKGVTDDGIIAICNSCQMLSELNLSYLAGLTDTGVAATTNCSLLETLISRGNPNISTKAFAQCIASCHRLKEVDLCGCDNITEAIVESTISTLEKHPRRLILHIAGTAAPLQKYPSHRYLYVNVDEDLCDPQLRTDFVDHMLPDNSSDNSFDDYYDPDIEEFLGSDDDENYLHLDVEDSDDDYSYADFLLL